VLIEWVKNRGLSIFATLVFALFAFAVFSKDANAHGNSDQVNIVPENAAYVDVDTGHVNDPSYASSHCHSISGQDCSTQFAFIITFGTLAKTTNFDVFVSFYRALRTDWLLSFDPPPPRVQS